MGFFDMGKEILDDCTLLGKLTIAPIFIIINYTSLILLAPLILGGFFISKCIEKLQERYPILRTQINVSRLFIKKENTWKYF